MLEEGNWIMSVDMGWLLHHYEPAWNRLSRDRAGEISAWLQKHELEHLPSPLPARRSEQVMLYKPKSPIGAYINAARLEGPFERHPGAAAEFLGRLAQDLGWQSGEAEHGL
ncbi:hypothetical protein [Streptomyces sp. SAJ15]|uniref:hypothetical protein n=1 Tax=Streptomyces sp. SAJ15 TaxID=2011095 RepID=UPI00118629EA|nr:hypothetical protein [Streptomyces sp. SAJ15]TVL94155.1 hypothetical protein CD790_03935 [Streptomyces sp. SAJ15]